eukprot:10785246-Alexandrium_andersonii.AAC.1
MLLRMPPAVPAGVESAANASNRAMQMCTADSPTWPTMHLPVSTAECPPPSGYIGYCLGELRFLWKTGHRRSSSPLHP